MAKKTFYKLRYNTKKGKVFIGKRKYRLSADAREAQKKKHIILVNTILCI